MWKFMSIGVTALIVALSANPAACEIITNPSFEYNGSINDIENYSIEGWSVDDVNPSKFMGWVQNYGGVTEGFYSLGLYNNSYNIFGVGEHISVWQDVDLTVITEIMFDVELSTEYPEYLDFSEADFAALFLIDGIPYWTGTSSGEYLDQTIDVSELSGVHKVELRLEATAEASVPYYYSNIALWDNLRAIPEPATLLLLGLGGLALRRKK